MDYLPADQWRPLAAQTAVGTALTLAHSLRARGLRRTLRFAGLGLGLPFVGEYVGINLIRLVRHRTRPQFLGVPLNAALGWYNIGYASFALVESLAPAGLPPGRRRLLLPAATAVLATSLDLILDCFGLAEGYWEWSQDGLYAPEIGGANGRHGIPITNFISWILLTGTVTLLYLRLSDDPAPEPARPGAAGSVQAGRTAALLLLPYYGQACRWAVRGGHFRPIAYSLLVPLALALALRGRPRR
jgi:uncharacterized membrane protein